MDGTAGRPSPDPRPVLPVFVGSGRSGTTLLRNMFDAHPRLAMCHEAQFVGRLAGRRSRYETGGTLDTEALVTDLMANSNFRRQGIDETTVRRGLVEAGPTSLAGGIRTIFDLYAMAHGKDLYGDKTPGYVTQIAEIADLLPEARFVHIVRDGRDVATSYLDRSEWGPATMAEAALYWESRVLRGRRAGSALGPERYREVRYEDLVDDPEAVIRSLCGYLGLDFDPAMLRYHEKGEAFVASTKDPEAFTGLTRPVTRGMRDWRSQMTEDDMALFEAIAGELLADLGYPLSGTRRSGMALKVGVARARWQGKRLMARAAASRRPTGAGKVGNGT